MTQPRCIRPNTTVLITRRTQRRTHLFRPDDELSQLYLYVLAVIAKRYAIRVHAVVLMSTHEHLIVTDTRGCLPNFLRELHRLFALGVKVLRKWEGAVWDHERPSVVELRTPEAVLEKLAYVMANPVAAGLVRAAKDWRGIQTLPHDLGQKILRASRPAFYFDQDNPLWPQQASLQLTMPEVGELTGLQIRDIVHNELTEQERQARANVKHRRATVVGMDRIRRASPFEQAKSWEPLRSRNPQFAVGRQQKHAFFEAVAALRAFRRAYRDALDRWRCGLRATCFPEGTWVMRVLHAATTA
jgi:REP element-mobilizing transposase RayT